MVLAQRACFLCPYFYYAEKTFAVVFVAAGVRTTRGLTFVDPCKPGHDARTPVVRAIISRSTRAFRRILELAQIPFTAPFLHTGEGDTEEQNRSRALIQPSDDSSRERGVNNNRYSLKNGHATFSLDKQHANTSHVSPPGLGKKLSEGERQSELEEELRQYENAASVGIYSTRARAFASPVPGDSGPMSLLRFDGSWAVRGFAEVLLNRIVRRNLVHGNFRAAWNMGDLRVNDIPTLLAPASTPFPSATLKRPRMSHHLRHGQQLHVHFNGIVLPTSAKQFIEHMQHALFPREDICHHHANIDRPTLACSCSYIGNTHRFSTALENGAR